MRPQPPSEGTRSSHLPTVVIWSYRFKGPSQGRELVQSCVDGDVSSLQQPEGSWQ